jgi:hypothetical protein
MHLEELDVTLLLDGEIRVYIDAAGQHLPAGLNRND